MTRWPVRQLALAGLVGVGAGLGFVGTFATGDLLSVVLVAAVVATGVALATWRLRSSLVVVAGQLAAWLATSVVLLARSGEDGAMATLSGALRDGWTQLLTSVVPTPAEPELLAVPFTVVWLATATGAELCRRTRSPLAPLAPAVAVAVVAELAGPIGVDGPAVGTVVVLVAGLALGAVRALLAEVPADAPSPSPVALRRRLVQVAPVVTAALVVGVVVVPNLPGVDDRDPWRLRDAATEPPLEPLAQHPLTALGAAYQDQTVDDGVDDRQEVVLRISFDREPPTTVDATGAPVLHLPMAAYDRYDGATWSSSAPYRPTGAELPPALVQPDAGSTETVRQEVEVLAPAVGPWLPTLAGPRRVEADGALTYDALGDVVALDERPEPGTRYMVVSDVPVTEGVRQRATPGVPSDEVDFTTLAGGDPTLEPDLSRVRQIAQQLFATPVPYPEQLDRLEGLFTNRLPDTAAILSIDDAVVERGIQQAFAWPQLPAGAPTSTTADTTASGRARIPVQVPTGHGIGRLNTFLFLPPDDGGEPAPNAGLGTPEQFATAAALIGRAQTIPTRVVVGYTVPYTGGATVEVQRGHADAWVEAWSPVGGWLPLAATPPPTPIETLASATTTSTASTATSIVPDASITPSSVPVVVNEAPAAAEPTSPTGRLLALALVVACAAATIVGLLAGAVAVRRRRRNQGAPAARLAGAWEEALRTLRVAGVDVSTAQSPSEAADAAAAAGLPTNDLLALGRLVLRGAHAVGEPLVGDAGMAWHHVGAMRREVRRSVPAGARLRLALDPRRGVRRPTRVPRPSAASRPRAAGVDPTVAATPHEGPPPLVGVAAGAEPPDDR